MKFFAMAANCPDPPNEPAVPGDEISLLGSLDHTMKVDVPKELGPYRLTKLLGRGGMGEVWQAFDMNLERDVAVKLMRKELLANEEAVKRFAREARAVARLNHPNIVQVYTFGDQGGVLYFVMEMVEGETITQRMKACGPIPIGECVFLLLQAIEGLSYANARGIIHRDIKPSNLMLTPDYRVKIADFGLAKMVEHDTQMTAAGTTMGSPNYMSPEQAKGEEADHRSDIYALGISMYQMLTGTLPFTADSPLSVLLKQIQEPLPEPEKIRVLGDGAVLDVIKKMTSKDPEQRYQTYGGLAAAISNLAPDVRVKGSHVPTASMKASTGAEVGAGSAAAAAHAEAGLIRGANESATGTLTSPPAAQLQPPNDTALASHRTQSEPNSRTMAIAGGVVALMTFIGAGLYFLTPRGSEQGMTGVNSYIPPARPQATQQVDVAASPIVETPPPAPTLTPVASSTPPLPAVEPTPVPQPQVAATVAAPMPPPPIVASVTPMARNISQLVLGRAGGGVIGLRDASGSVIANLPPGTKLPYTSVEGVGQRAQYVVTYNGNPAYVSISEAQPDLLANSGVVASANASARVGIKQETAQPTPVPKLVLGTAGASRDERVPLYREPRPVREELRLPAGTEVILVEEAADMYRVQLQNGRTMYVLKKMAQQKQ